MKRKGFTLLELMAAVLLGSLVMLIIAGGLRAAIRSWESVNTRVSVNYNRRNVLDLIKRQASSLFFRSDVAELEGASNSNSFRNVTRNRARTLQEERLRAQNRANPVERQQTSGFIVPDGCSFFSGHVQELNFLSTLSFLSDFPGQVAVRYYVVQGSPDEGQTLADLPHSRSESAADDVEFDPDNPGFEDDVEEIEGNLYLYIEEKNLFLAATMPDHLSDENNPFAEVDEDREDNGDQDPNSEPNDHNMQDNQNDHSADVSQVFATNAMRMIGPLRKFSIRYRKPGTIGVDHVDSEDDWANSWDIDRVGSYPVAIEFTLVFEPEGDPEKAADLDLDALEGVRMVIPVYDAQNLIRGQKEPLDGN